MALARLRSEWVRAAWMTAWAINRNGMQKQPVDPLKLIPAPFRPPEPPRVRTPEEIEHENRLGWVALDRFFGGR